jgi:hypothetical protein
MEQMIGNYVSGVQGLDRRTQGHRLLRGDDSGSGDRGGHPFCTHERTQVGLMMTPWLKTGE